MKLKSKLKFILSVFLLFLVSLPTMAQSREVKGTVLSAVDQTPVIGATIVVKGTSTGTITDVNGSYHIEVPGNDAVLVFQFIGLEPQEVPVGNQTIINITMQESSVELEDVVVTALGMTREQKSLGYALTKVDNEELTQTASRNWLNGMSG